VELIRGTCVLSLHPFGLGWFDIDGMIKQDMVLRPTECPMQGWILGGDGGLQPPYRHEHNGALLSFYLQILDIGEVVEEEEREEEENEERRQ
jgi:hypothetical protein